MKKQEKIIDNGQLTIDNEKSRQESLSIIKVEHLSKSYGAASALSDVGFEVNRGELFGIIGADGAGKTTLFRILTTLLLPDKGNATVDGLDVVKDYRKLRSIVGYMPGRFSLYQDMTVEENLNFFATLFGTTVAQNYELIKDIYIQIEPFKKRKAGALSGGMKQKLALSCALIHKPKVLFLDEPTTGVDPISRKEFWQMLKRLKAEGITILVSTPYMDEASLCDRIALIQNGSFMKVASPNDVVKAYPTTLYEVFAENKYQTLNILRSNPDVESCYISGESLRMIMKNDANNLPAGIDIRKITPTVEDCFIQLMNNAQ